MEFIDLEKYHNYLKNKLNSVNDVHFPILQRVQNNNYATKNLSENRAELEYVVNKYFASNEQFVYFCALATIHFEFMRLRLKKCMYHFHKYLQSGNMARDTYLLLEPVGRLQREFPKLAYLNITLGETKFVVDYFEKIATDVKLEKYKAFWLDMEKNNNVDLPEKFNEKQTAAQKNALKEDLKSMMQQMINDELKEARATLKECVKQDLLQELQIAIKADFKNELMTEWKGQQKTNDFISQCALKECLQQIEQVRTELQETKQTFSKVQMEKLREELKMDMAKNMQEKTNQMLLKLQIERDMEMGSMEMELKRVLKSEISNDLTQELLTKLKSEIGKKLMEF